MTRHSSLAAIVCSAALIVAWGCSGTDVQMHNPAGYIDMPKGPCAVLEVTAHPLPKPKSYDVLWGIVRDPEQQRTIADILSRIARTEGGLMMIDPVDVGKKLKLSDLELDYEPTPQEIDACVRALGCASYLSVYVEEWRFTYFLTGSKATARLVVACHVPGAEAPLWWVRVTHISRGKDDRQVAATALRAAFQALTRFRPIPPGWGQ